ncbi:MAG: ribonuclease PH [Myxococcales bacterium]|nr:ribonuclease PH [Myxococcales bacterium]MCB9708940.1 ribonuclease PH [Myxococcales bacterium]
MRIDGRQNHQLRPVEISLNVQRYPEGSLLFRAGGTQILIAVSVEDGVRDFLRGSGLGWVTAEYAMHPRANKERQARDSRRGKIDGRVQEIQRLIGRALRAAVVPKQLGERTIVVDCDVLDADGGTRTACVTGGFIAMALALDPLCKDGTVGTGVLREAIAAISVGLVNDEVLLDLCYREDSSAEVDLNVVGTCTQGIVEVQGTSEDAPIPRAQFNALLDVALLGIPQLIDVQMATLKDANVNLTRLLAS